jgi:hypothetical protein
LIIDKLIFFGFRKIFILIKIKLIIKKNKKNIVFNLRFSKKIKVKSSKKNVLKRAVLKKTEIILTA